MTRLILIGHMLHRLFRNDGDVELKKNMTKIGVGLYAGIYGGPIAARAASTAIDYIFDSQVSGYSGYELDKRQSSNYASLAGELVVLSTGSPELGSFISKSFGYLVDLEVKKLNNDEFFKKFITKELASPLTDYVNKIVGENINQLPSSYNPTQDYLNSLRKQRIKQAAEKMIEPYVEKIYNLQPNLNEVSKPNAFIERKYQELWSTSNNSKFIRKMILSESINRGIFEPKTIGCISDEVTIADLQCYLNSYRTNIK
jgi:hypothetical protein